jgi:glyoxylase-like metal-dependent hydrolase (beta-lactamase superfamily II)
MDEVRRAKSNGVGRKLYEEFMNAQIVSRRRFLATTSLAASAMWVNPRGLFAQSAVPPLVVEARAAAAKAEIRTQSLRGNVSALLGSGGNIAVLPGKDGKVLIDAGFASSQPKMEVALAAISGDPMTHLINTHWHFDHTDGNEWMHAAGATILAHANTKKRLSTTQTIAAFNATFPPSPAGAIPTETLTEKKVLTLNGTTLVLEYYGPAHTDTDISIHFPDADVMHVGDTWFNGFYPFIDTSTGGSINGMIRATEKNLAAVGAKTIVIPGHGPVGDRAQLTEYHEMLVFARDQVAALKKQGKTLAEVVAAKPTAKYDEKWGGSAKGAASFIGYVYEGV